MRIEFLATSEFPLCLEQSIAIPLLNVKPSVQVNLLRNELSLTLLSEDYDASEMIRLSRSPITALVSIPERRPEPIKDVIEDWSHGLVAGGIINNAESGSPQTK